MSEAMAAGDYDKIATLAQEAKAMEAAKGEMIDSAHGEALETNQQVDEVKAAQEKADRIAAVAEQARLDAENSAKEAAALLEKLKNGNMSGSSVEKSESASVENTEKVREIEESLMRLREDADSRDFNQNLELDSTRNVLKGLDSQTQEKLAQDFFDHTIGTNILMIPKTYQLYLRFKGTEFAKKFAELEDTRLKRAGYGGFRL